MLANQGLYPGLCMRRAMSNIISIFKAFFEFGVFLKKNDVEVDLETVKWILILGIIRKFIRK